MVKKYEILFADLDGTLIETISGETFPQGIWDMKLRFDVLDKIKELNPKHLFIISNQGGIEYGYISENWFKIKMNYIVCAIRAYLSNENVRGMWCPSNDKSHPLRKPNTGMIEELLATFVGDDFDYIKTKTLMIGDASGKEGQFSDSDKKAAENFGCDYLDVEDFINSRGMKMKTGIELIAEERQRQIEEEGWTAEHDKQWAAFELAEAAACYAHPFIMSTNLEWPFDKSWWKPSENRIRDLQKAGALIAAEIDRLLNS